MATSTPENIAPKDSNALHKEEFQQLHMDIVRSVNPASIIDYLFANKVISADDMGDLHAIRERPEQCRRLMALLHRSSHPQAFIQLRLALKNEDAYSWIEDRMRNLSLAGAAQVLRTLAEGLPIWGVATLGNEFYIVRDKEQDHVEVYDVNSFSLKRCLSVPGARSLADMTSCGRHQCLYISDNVVKCIYRLELNGKVTQWPVGDAPHGLSMTVDCNVLVTCQEVRKLKLFNASSGDIITQICLQSDVVTPWQAIQLATGQYVVCHGQLSDAVHRVCLVDADGKTVATYGGECGSAAGQMNVPFRLAVDSDGFIFVVDLNNKRVLLLSPNLAPVCDVVSRGQAFKWWPHRLCLDVNRRRLYVAENGELKDGELTAGRLVVFSV